MPDNDKEIVSPITIITQQYHLRIEVHCYQVIPNRGILDIYETKQ